MDHYATEEQIEAIVSGFEQCTTNKDQFNHLSHLTVAVYYLRHSTPEEAVEKMRTGLFRFLDHHGIDRAKYDEQVTRNWITLVQGVIQQMDSDTSLLAVTNAVLEQLGDSRMVNNARQTVSLGSGPETNGLLDIES